MAYTAIDDSSAHSQTAIYTGTGSSRSVTNGGNSDLQPDLVWIKSRSAGDQEHNLYDSSRGTGKRLIPSSSAAEDSRDGVTAFNSDGFTTNYSDANTSSATYVAWQWKANGGTRTTNTESGNNPAGGYQASTTAGFSIVDYTGTGSAGTMAHGLGVEPKVMIVKNRDATTDWAVYHRNASATGNDSYLELNTTDASATAGSVWNDTSPTSSVFTVGTNTKTNTDGEKYIAYCFTDIQGYSKYGNYEGNNNSDGPFLYTGFQPALFIVKNVDSTAAWRLYSNKISNHNGLNDLDRVFYPNANDEESGTGHVVDFLSNGIKIRGDNEDVNDAESYIYMAWAEHPFVSSGGVPCTAR